jgi:hypothetical protein
MPGPAAVTSAASYRTRILGKNILSNNFDARLLKGWGVRPSDWNLGVTIQQQIGQRSSLDVTYSRRWYRGFSVIDNLAWQPDDLSPFSVVAPPDSRLPGGGGYVVSGLYDVVPAKAGQGQQPCRRWRGLWQVGTSISMAST